MAKQAESTGVLRDAWKALEAARHQSDYEKADLLRRMRVACESEGRDFMEFLTDTESGLGLHARAALGCQRMAEVVDLLGDAAAWGSVGWGGMQRVLKVEVPSERKAVVAAIKKASHLSQKGFAELLAAKAPSLKKQRTSAQAKSDVLQAALMERKILLVALRAINRDYALIVSHTVSDEARALIGVQEPVAV